MMPSIKRFIRKAPSIYYPLKVVQRTLRGENTPEFYRNEGLRQLEAIELVPVPKKRAMGGPALIEITNGCNLNCLMCSTKLSTRPPSLMTPEDFELVLRELKSVGISSIALHTVGETFIHKKLHQILALVRKHGFTTRLSTNAQLPEKIEAICREFPDVANNIRFSIDGATKETYELIRKGGKFEKVMESLEVIHRINRGKPNSRVFFAIDAVISMTNFREIPLFFEKFSKYVWPEYMNFHLINGVTPDSSFFREVFPFPNLVRYHPPCAKPFNSLHFTYDAKATHCSRDYNGELVVGDLHEQSYMDIWNSEASEKIRNQHRDISSLEIEACKNCYIPYAVVSDVVTNYVKYLYVSQPKLSPDGFHDCVVRFLQDMDDALADNNLEKFKSVVQAQFT
ncbi:MAG: hypothetical protein A2516_08645 [Alphaproteobacteria bacterium RIFOXYD12_FULL_60_8]|nr:MAG: hypothetical protein A2516_08645 [Alphaproteobacteria bacterium RIFOXYD12_FULL_60_8]